MIQTIELTNVPIMTGLVIVEYHWTATGGSVETKREGVKIMDSFEPKKLALIRIWQILKEYSDYDHPMTQEDISGHLENDYGIVIERKAISRNISLLKEAGIEIESRRAGSYLESRDFDDSELRMKMVLTIKTSRPICHICTRISKNALILSLIPLSLIRLLTGLAQMLVL